MTPREFLDLIAPAAQASARRSGVPASVTLAQAALESGWGESQLAREAKNLFGIKASDGWAGDTITLPTREVIGGQSVTVTAVFRCYRNWQGSIDDHADFLLGNRRYRPAFAAASAEEFARAIAAAGYATDPAYADKLIQIMRTHALAAFDTMQAAPPVAVPGAAEATTAPAPSAPQPMEASMAGEGDTAGTAAAGLAQAAATMVTAVSPPLGALLQVAAGLYPKIGQLVLDKDKTVPQRNVAIGAAVLDSIAQATNAPTRIEGLARAANDPAARDAAAKALEPYFAALDSSGMAQARKDLLTAPIGNKWEAARAIGYGLLVGAVALILIIGGGWMLYAVLMDATTAQQTKGMIIGFLTGTVITAPIYFLFGGSATNRAKDQTIQRAVQSLGQ